MSKNPGPAQAFFHKTGMESTADSNRGESVRNQRLKSDIHPSTSKDLTNLQTAKLELPLKKVSYERKIRARHRWTVNIELAVIKWPRVFFRRLFYIFW